MAVTANNLELYRERDVQWWGAHERRFLSLRNLSSLRLSYVQELFDSLADRRVLDLGCGAGFLAIPLAEQGAQVLGLDQSEAAIEQAQAQAALRGCAQHFEGRVANVLGADIKPESFDIVILADVVEHVKEYSELLKTATWALKPGGYALISTLNRTIASRFLAVWFCESVRLVPPGTHDWRLFVTPRELEVAATACGLVKHRVYGESPRIVPTILSWSLHMQPGTWLGASYAMIFRRPA